MRLFFTFGLTMVIFSLVLGAGPAADLRKPIKLDEWRGKDVAERQQILKAVFAQLDTSEADLERIVATPKRIYDINDEVLLAIQTLGRLRAVSAVPVLLERIDISPPIISHDPMRDEDTYPCYGALVEIGRPSSRAALLMLANGKAGGVKLDLLQKLILRVEGAGVADAFITDEISRASGDKTLQARMQKVRADLAKITRPE